MKDFDFDELDRAVSSALGGMPAQSPRPAEEQSRPLDPRPVDTARQRQVSPQQPQRSAAVISPRSAMDIVRPAGSTPQLRRPLVQETQPEAVEQAPVRQEVPMMDIRPVPRREVESIVSRQGVEQPADLNIDNEEWSLPTESPFLPDAKVEKRPLGSSYPTGTAVASTVEAAETPISQATNEGVGLNPSISGDSNVEPDMTPQEILDPLAMNPSSIDDIESIPEFDVIESQPEASPAPAVTETPAAIEYSGPSSITPQYTPQPRTEQESGEIFDTESYHQPFPATAKKKSYLPKILVAVGAVIILGIGAGAAVYFFLLPSL